MMGNFFNRIMGRSPVSQAIEIQKTASKWRDITDSDLKNKAAELKDRARKGEKEQHLLTEAFACAVIAAERSIGLHPFDVQIQGGIALAQGKVAEMKTGEGKTLAATMPAFLLSLYGKGVHMVTVNDYLARRDAEWMGPVYKMLGASVGCIQENMADTPKEETALRQAAYACDITYVTNSECVFDYLRDNLAVSKDQLVHRFRHAAILDEIDLLLIDEAQMPLIISGSAADDKSVVLKADSAVRQLRPGRDFEVDRRQHAVTLTEAGQFKVESLLGVGTLEDPDNVAFAHVVHQALQAYGLYERDVAYMVQDKSVYIIDDHTGRASPEKRYSNGLHQALEAKERLPIRGENTTLSKSSYQHYFRSYARLSGMTGTAWSVRRELEAVYGLEVVRIPTCKPMIRADYRKTLLRTAEEKRAAVVSAIVEAHKAGRPVLVGTLSVEESEAVSKMLTAASVPHQVLNARHHAQEAEIVAQAGRLGAVTVSTNMAGRGTDIMLGGDPKGAALKATAWDSPEFEATLGVKERQCGVEREKVIKAGGLLVIGTGEHDAERIDDQLRGRAGRQGDPGASYFYISLDDPLYKRFGEQKILPLLKARCADQPYGVPIRDPSVLKALNSLRISIETNDGAARKEVLRFDSVLHERRETVWEWRRSLLMTENRNDWHETVRELINDLVDRLGEETFAAAETQATPVTKEDRWNQVYTRITHPHRAPQAEGITVKDREGVITTVDAMYQARLGTPHDEQLMEWERILLLHIIDTLWPRYLNDLESVEQDVHLRTYAQVDPFVAFRTEAARMFGELMIDIQLSALRAWLSAQVTEHTAAASNPRLQKKASDPPKKKPGPEHRNKQKRHGKRIVARRAPVPV